MVRTLALSAVAILIAGLSVSPAPAQMPPAQTTYATREGDFTIPEFKFRDGETLKNIRLHYTTLGTPRRDASGRVTNAVMVLHGTGGDGHQFLRPQFAGVLFVPGGLLDPAKYFIVLPDNIGHGKSSKPSDGLGMKFPHYGYADMVALQHALLVDGLHVDHLRLVMGTSMGCMHSFLWAETYPDFIDAAMPLACLPIEIAGRNRIWRRMLIEGIENDPSWDGGNYKTEPKEGLRVAADMLLIAGSAAHQWQKAYPTAQATDAFLHDYVDREIATLDADDLIYQVDASRDYDPSKELGRITAPVMWVNSADDFINPPELGIAPKMVAQIRRGRFVLIPVSDATHGHGTHTWAAVWKDYMAELLTKSEKK